MTRQVFVSYLLFAAFGLCQCVANIKPNKSESQTLNAFNCSEPNLSVLIESICRLHELKNNRRSSELKGTFIEKDDIPLLRNPYLRNTPLRVFVIIFGVISLIILLGALLIYLAHTMKLYAPAAFFHNYNFLTEAFYDSHLSRKTKIFTLFYFVTLLIFVFVFITLSDRKTLKGDGGCWFIAGLNYYLMTSLCTLSIILLFRVMAELSKWKPHFYCVVNFFSGESNFAHTISMAFVTPGVLLLIFALCYYKFLKRTDDFCWIRSEHRFPSIGVPVIMHIICLLLLIPILARRFPHLWITKLVNKLFLENSDVVSCSGEGRPKAFIKNVHTHFPAENCAYWWHFVPQIFLGLIAIFEAISYSHNQITFWHIMFSLLLTLKVPVLFALRLWHWKRHRARHVVSVEEDVESNVAVRKTLTDTAHLPENFIPVIQTPDLDIISEQLEPIERVPLQILEKSAELQSLHSKILDSSRDSVISCSTDENVSKDSTAEVKEPHTVYKTVPLEPISYSMEELTVTEDLPEIPLEIESKNLSFFPATSYAELKKMHAVDESDEEIHNHDAHVEEDHEVLKREDALDAPPKPPRGVTPQDSIIQDISITPPPTPFVDVSNGSLSWWSKTLRSESSENVLLERLHEASNGKYLDEDTNHRRESQTATLEFDSESSDAVIESVNIIKRGNDLEYMPLETYTPLSTSIKSHANIASSQSHFLHYENELKTDAYFIENETTTSAEDVSNVAINVYVRQLTINESTSVSFKPLLLDLPHETASMTTIPSSASSLSSLLRIGHESIVEEDIVGHETDADDTFRGRETKNENRSFIGHSPQNDLIGTETQLNKESLTSASTALKHSTSKVGYDHVRLPSLYKTTTSSTMTDFNGSVSDTKEIVQDIVNTESQHFIENSHQSLSQFSKELLPAKSDAKIVETTADLVIFPPNISVSKQTVYDGTENKEHSIEGDTTSTLYDRVHDAITHSISQSLLATHPETTTNVHWIEDTNVTNKVETIEINVDIRRQDDKFVAIALSVAPVELPTDYASDSDSSLIYKLNTSNNDDNRPADSSAANHH